MIVAESTHGTIKHTFKNKNRGTRSDAQEVH